MLCVQFTYICIYIVITTSFVFIYNLLSHKYSGLWKHSNLKILSSVNTRGDALVRGVEWFLLASFAPIILQQSSTDFFMCMNKPTYLCAAAPYWSDSVNTVLLWSLLVQKPLGTLCVFLLPTSLLPSLLPPFFLSHLSYNFILSLRLSNMSTMHFGHIQPFLSAVNSISATPFTSRIQHVSYLAWGCGSLVELLPSRYEALDFTTNENHKALPNSAKLKQVNQLLVYTHHTRSFSLIPVCTMAYHMTFYLAIFWNSYHIGWMDLLKCINSHFLLKYAAVNLQLV